MQSYSDLHQEYGSGKIPYHELLKTTEWSKKRNRIISRESNVCQACKTACIDDYILRSAGSGIFWEPGIYKEIEVEKDYYCKYTGEVLFTATEPSFELVKQIDPHFAHVHHTYYILSNLPWEYDDDDLMLLCHKCHTKLHATQEVKVFLTKHQMESVNCIPCTRCNGTGHLPEFNHIEGGVCFRCKGACFEEWI